MLSNKTRRYVFSHDSVFIAAISGTINLCRIMGNIHHPRLIASVSVSQWLTRRRPGDPVTVNPSSHLSVDLPRGQGYFWRSRRPNSMAADKSRRRRSRLSSDLSWLVLGFERPVNRMRSPKEESLNHSFDIMSIRNTGHQTTRKNLTQFSTQCGIQRIKVRKYGKKEGEKKSKISRSR